ncbi:MAG TPA: hypothetical protein VFK05_04205 [Polyangiaceae bacterium]|nr:hypothetical protein [Polyangiaceae bacterium]
MAFSIWLGACSQGAHGPEPMANEAAGAPSASPDGQSAGMPGGGASAAAGSGAGAPGAVPPTTDGGGPTSVTWKVIAESPDTNLFAGVPAAASRIADGAVAYVESTNTAPSPARVVMQRFDANGERLGSLIALTEDPGGRSDVTLASDGRQYAACWTTDLEVRCSLISEDAQVQPDTLALAGKNPTIAASPSGWALAYAASDTRLLLQALSPALEPSGDPVELTLSAQIRTQGHAPLFVATPSGFALVGAGSEDGHDNLLRLSADLKPLAPATPLGHDLWFSGQLVASDTRAALSLAAPYGAYLLFLNTAQVTGEIVLGGGQKEGIDQALLLSRGGIGAAWLYSAGEIRQRFFADGHDHEVGLPTGRSPSSVPGTDGSDSYQQLVTVGDQVLILARARKRGNLAGDMAIRIATLTFP